MMMIATLDDSGEEDGSAASGEELEGSPDRKRARSDGGDDDRASDESAPPSYRRLDDTLELLGPVLEDAVGGEHEAFLHEIVAFMGNRYMCT